MSESPELKVIEAKLMKFQRGLGKKTKEMAEVNEKHEKEVAAIWGRVDVVNVKVDGLYEMTAKVIYYK